MERNNKEKTELRYSEVEKNKGKNNKNILVDKKKSQQNQKGSE